MPCFHPLRGWYSKSVNPSGKRSVVFSRSEGYVDMPVDVPCGQCIGCRLERSRVWAVRCLHEASLHDDNCFITLTFDDEFVKPSLVKADFQKFMKRLRKRFSGFKIRYFHCGEYGELMSRPHHHACLFGFDFPDKIPVRLSSTSCSVWRSAILEELWPFGFSSIGEVSFESAAYVARYVCKKITGDMKEDHYGSKLSEYCTMSRRPGIAHDWIKRYHGEVYSMDKVVVSKDVQCMPPRFYDKYFEVDNADEMYKIKVRRKVRGKLSPDNSPDRLAAREVVVKQKFKQKGRSYEDGRVCDFR